MPALSDQQLHDALGSLPGWEGTPERLTKTFEFDSFSEALGWMVRVALEVEKADHHPTWSNTYATVEVQLSSHDAGGVTERDVALARVMDALATRATGS